MSMSVDLPKLQSDLLDDREFGYKARGLTAVVRIALTAPSVDVVVKDGAVIEVRVAQGEADVLIQAPEGFWADFARSGDPKPGFESLTLARAHGVSVQGDVPSLVAPYQGALQRLFQVLRGTVCGHVERPHWVNPFKETDNAVGRYVYVTANDAEARIYYEEAGTGDVPLLLQSTAGGDGRQYRNLLADPEMQKRFRMIAYDLPAHGKSLPPGGIRWWEKPYAPGKDQLMNWVVGLADELQLEQPFFLGCSVGGQLALDLAASHPDRFGAFISLNGWLDGPPGSANFDNDVFRTPGISEDYAMSLILGSTSHLAPEELAHEVYWIYRSNFPGIYAGDNDYFMHGHDLSVDGDALLTITKPVYALAGEYDPAARSAEHGGQAVAARFPTVTYKELKGLGHFAPSEDPIGFRDAILPILDEALERVASGGSAIEPGTDQHTPRIDFDHHSETFAHDWTDQVARLHELDFPLAWSEAYGGFWVLGSFEEGLNVLTDWETFTSENHLDGGGNGGRGQLIPQAPYPLALGESDPPLHTQRRRIEAPFFTPKALRRWRPVAEEFINESIDAVAGTGRVDLIFDLIMPTTARTPLHLLGWDPNEWRMAVESKVEGDYTVLRQRFREELTIRRNGGGTDVISTLGRASVNGEPLALEHGESMVNALFFGGFDTTTSLISHALLYLDEHPELREKVRDDQNFRQLFTEEMLRLFSPTPGIARTAVRDVEIAGRRIAKGERVLVWLNAANRDPKAYPAPDTADVTRPNVRDHLAFSGGSHRCLGSPLAKVEADVVIETILRRLPNLRIDRSQTTRTSMAGAHTFMFDRMPATFDIEARA